MPRAQGVNYCENHHVWKNLTTIIKTESTRKFKNSEKPVESAIRYYITSLEANPIDFQKAVRAHWSIENKLHWALDASFAEDASRKRAGNAAQNFSSLNKIALNLLKNGKTAKVGIKSRTLKARWNNQYLIKVVNLLIS